MTATAFRFEVRGEPVGKARPRAASVGGRVRMYTPAATVAYEQSIAAAAREAIARVGYVYPACAWYALEVFVYRTHERRGPDLDNVAKAVGDALNGIAWRDDAQVYSLRVELTETRSPAPRIVVRVFQYPRASRANRQPG